MPAFCALMDIKGVEAQFGFARKDNDMATLNQLEANRRTH